MMDSFAKNDGDSALYFSDYYESSLGFMIFLIFREKLSYIILSQFAKGIDCVN